MKPTTVLHKLAQRTPSAALQMARIACSVAAALAFWGAHPAPAAACSCISSAELVWPVMGATGVSTRPDIVIYRAWPIDVELRDPDGELVPLRERTAATVKLTDACSAPVTFLETEAPLAANTKYELSFRSRDPNAPLLNWLPPARSFTTGASASGPAPAAALELRSYRLRSSTGLCDARLYETCNDFVQVELGGPAVTAGEPLFFSFSAPFREHTENLTISLVPGSEYAPRASDVYCAGEDPGDPPTPPGCPGDPSCTDVGPNLGCTCPDGSWAPYCSACEGPDTGCTCPDGRWVEACEECNHVQCSDGRVVEDPAFCPQNMCMCGIGGVVVDSCDKCPPSGSEQQSVQCADGSFAPDLQSCPVQLCVCPTGEVVRLCEECPPPPPPDRFVCPDGSVVGDEGMCPYVYDCGSYYSIDPNCSIAA